MKNTTDALDFSINYNYSVCSAYSSKSKRCVLFLYLFLFLIIIAGIFNSKELIFWIAFISNLTFAANFIFKTLLVFIYTTSKKTEYTLPNFTEAELPIYTILLPCYKEEEETLRNLISGILNLNYPKNKLDVKFLLEEDDDTTIKNLAKIEHNFEVLLVPKSIPKTKPKACNFGLYFARGEFVVIYDAEDKPDSDQLLKAINYFKHDSEDLICVQCRLNFYNARQNLLAACFSLEYLVWFNAFLPALSNLNFLIPLGGTSNHFKTKRLIEIGGWDPYNVTEDAELGVRIAKKGYRVSAIESYTLEEAPFRLKEWIPQRQRWMKGYLQTFLSHLLDVKGNIKAGLWYCFCLFTLVGFSFLSFILVPVSFGVMFFEGYKNPILVKMFFLNGFFCILYISTFFYVSIKEGSLLHKGISLFMPIYFILHSVAAILGFVQFFTNPFYWNKTRHAVKKAD